MNEIHWLTDEAYEKLEGSARLKVNGILGVFSMYGQQLLVPGAIEEIMQVMRWYGLQVRGVDKVPPRVGRTENPDR